MAKHYDEVTGMLEGWDPFALSTKANAADNPKWEEAMNGPNRDGFMDACRRELKTLVKMGVWEVVKRQPWMNVLPSSWAFKIKRFPDGLVRKLKARFVAGGHKQIHGVDFFDTFAPVVNWATVRMILILTCQLELKSKQVDWTAAFVHADIDRPLGYDNMTQDQVYVEMPCGFSQHGMVLKLNKNLYGLKQAPIQMTSVSALTCLSLYQDALFGSFTPLSTSITRSIVVQSWKTKELTDY